MATGATNINATRARDILDDFGVDPNSAFNGVYLPVKKGQVEIVIDELTFATHNGGHTKLYYQEVYDRLKDKTSHNQVKQALQELREDLMTGVLHIGKVK